MKCPKCDGTLNEVRVVTRPEYGDDVLKDAGKTAELTLDQCLECNGVWFDSQELEQYLAERLIILDSPKVPGHKKYDEKIGSCPKCHIEMRKKTAPNKTKVTVDICEKCQGIWLDSSELDKIEDKNFSFGEKHALVIRNLLGFFKKER